MDEAVYILINFTMVHVGSYGLLFDNTILDEKEKIKKFILQKLIYLMIASYGFLEFFNIVVREVPSILILLNILIFVLVFLSAKYVLGGKKDQMLTKWKLALFSLFICVFDSALLHLLNIKIQVF
ncbi:MAG: hypothetical protein CO150_08380 [Nitrospirae bacterium CG_4_9_14_3_um_filter_53_35]|nr:hypothetical protein [Alphaproteobacteria bacterium]OIN87332.1 MAG: hypothetical protein AUJ12_02410 [Alphaproteobacteria bacterium CG1_02_46_17]PIS36877.1 MAG: hypothetical protein COT35_08910 [Nitrospirae bacterium CG08_land_8_20_14_0_20_52_24]PIV82997.1 MAG: hypothetical protein COW52_10630 [Nitrospirae bacterium CG17_big_fil_post_rev_8_21_14_2_50_50_9]PIW84347.1 MAG: hypothetical protein COZ95_10315 [Nitrospirae bacterium CG_4_8_14_3_um_filter_50_41]PIX85437.1 MAG: hypothetical protein 